MRTLCISFYGDVFIYKQATHKKECSPVRSRAALADPAGDPKEPKATESRSRFLQFRAHARICDRGKKG